MPTTVHAGLYAPAYYDLLTILPCMYPHLSGSANVTKYENCTTSVETIKNEYMYQVVRRRRNKGGHASATYEYKTTLDKV